MWEIYLQGHILSTSYNIYVYKWIPMWIANGQESWERALWGFFFVCRQMMPRMTTSIHSCTSYPTTCSTSSPTGTPFYTTGNDKSLWRDCPPSLGGRETILQLAAQWCCRSRLPTIGQQPRFWSAVVPSSAPSWTPLHGSLPARPAVAFYRWRRTRRGRWRTCPYDATWETWSFSPHARLKFNQPLLFFG